MVSVQQGEGDDSRDAASSAPVLVTGAAGFIGYHVTQRLLRQGRSVVGIDNMNSYYDPALKQARRSELAKSNSFRFFELDICNRDALARLFSEHRFPQVIHLAAQAGVRYSIDHPESYVDTNLVGFLNVLEGCRHNGCRHLLFASSSSVYGANTNMPFSVHDGANHPISLYGATKRANELMAHAYSYLYRLPATGLRFFTVYGPWGRPDMAMFVFASAIAAGKPIRLFNHGQMRRDFTYVDDATEAVVRLLDRIPAPDPGWSGDAPDPATSAAPWRIYNIGNNSPVAVLQVVDLLEKELGRRAIREMAPMQPGDVAETRADVDDLMRDVGFRPGTPIEEGVRRFVKWYRDYAG
jgi:UDP-glucuronate 4-epimerase